MGETAWNNAYGGSQGGLSAFETEPSYQSEVQSSGMRSTPDVAFDADPVTGVSVYYISPTARNATSTSGRGWSSAGPASARRPGPAIIALADQSLAIANVASLSCTQALTDLYTLASASPGSFHGVTPASRDDRRWLRLRRPVHRGPVDARLLHGLGSLVGTSLLNGLVDEAEGTPLPRPPGPPRALSTV